MSKQQALDALDEFEARTHFKAFKKLDRAKVAADLRDRVKTPTLISQGDKAGVCGPAAVAYDILRSRPFTYVSAATRLFELGFAIINKWEIKPDDDLLNAPCPSSVAQGDWVVLASIRDSENWFLDFHEAVDGVTSGTSLDEIEGWMKKAGYSDVVKESDIFGLFDETDMFNNALKKYAAGYQVTFFINHNCIDSQIPKTLNGDHFVVLNGECKPPKLKSDPIKIPIYTWGKPIIMPRVGGLTYQQFLDQFFGYVAAKW